MLHRGPGSLGSAVGEDQVAETSVGSGKERRGDGRRCPATCDQRTRTPQPRRGRTGSGVGGAWPANRAPENDPANRGRALTFCITGAQAPEPAASPARSAKRSARPARPCPSLRHTLRRGAEGTRRGRSWGLQGQPLPGARGGGAAPLGRVRPPGNSTHQRAGPRPAGTPPSCLESQPQPPAAPPMEPGRRGLGAAH